jgi:hypothetical protein
VGLLTPEEARSSPRLEVSGIFFGVNNSVHAAFYGDGRVLMDVRRHICRKILRERYSDSAKMFGSALHGSFPPSIFANYRGIDLKVDH